MTTHNNDSGALRVWCTNSGKKYADNKEFQKYAKTTPTFVPWPKAMVKQEDK